MNYVRKLVKQMNIWPTPCSLKGLKETPADYHYFTGDFKESTLFYSTKSFNLSLKTNNTLDFPLRKVLVCRGSFQKWDANIIKILHW